MYLFDTDALSQIIKRNPSISFIKKLASVPPRLQFTTAITVEKWFTALIRAIGLPTS